MSKVFPVPTAQDSVSTVAASDLVRQFGLWQERAVRAPVYILHRGRPRLVLSSIETMEALCVSHTVDDARQAERDAVLDAMYGMLVLLDDDRRVRAASRTARAHVRLGATLADALDDLLGPAAALIDAGAQRVAARGIAETIECLSHRHPDRCLKIDIAPCATGLVVAIRDVSCDVDLARERAAHQAIDGALGASGCAARVDINARGYPIAPSPSLARLSGSAETAHCSVRFVSMFDVASRVAIGTAIEAAFDAADPVALDANLIVRSGGHRPVRIGLGAMRHDGTPDAVTAILIATFCG